MEQQCGFLQDGFKPMGRGSVYLGAGRTKADAVKQTH
jgi:hypothetical protein